MNFSHVTSGRRPLDALVLLGFIAASGCNWSSLWGLDAPRPALAEDDIFDVDPRCPDLIVDRSALASAPRTITIKGRRKDSGLGAEGVPVSVSRGPCDAVDDAPADAAIGADAGAGTLDAGASSSNDRAEMVCRSDFEPLEDALIGELELIGAEERGCRQRSPSKLECTLDARGEASFDIRGNFPNDELNLGGYVPICVSALTNSLSKRKESEVHVLPRFGMSKLAIAVLRLAEDENPHETIPDAGSGCDPLFDCAVLRVRGAFRAGLVSADIPTSELRTNDLLMLRRDAKIELSSTALSAVAGAPFLSTDVACPDDDAGTPLALTIEAGHSGSPTFFLCAPGYGASYEVSAKITEDRAPNDAGVEMEIASSADAPVARPDTIALPALPKSYIAAPLFNGFVVDTQLCGGEQVHAAPDEVHISGASQDTSGGQIILSCESAEMDDAGPAPTSDEVAACAEITLTTASGETCHLDVQQGE